MDERVAKAKMSFKWKQSCNKVFKRRYLSEEQSFDKMFKRYLSGNNHLIKCSKRYLSGNNHLIKCSQDI